MHKFILALNKTIFILNNDKLFFSMENIVIGTHRKHLHERFQMSSHKISFIGEISKVAIWMSLACYSKFIGPDKHISFEHRSKNIFLPISFNICFGSPKEQSQ